MHGLERSRLRGCRVGRGAATVSQATENPYCEPRCSNMLRAGTVLPGLHRTLTGSLRATRYIASNCRADADFDLVCKVEWHHSSPLRLDLDIKFARHWRISHRDDETLFYGLLTVDVRRPAIPSRDEFLTLAGEQRHLIARTRTWVAAIRCGDVASCLIVGLMIMGNAMPNTTHSGCTAALPPPRLHIRAGLRDYSTSFAERNASHGLRSAP